MIEDRICWNMLFDFVFWMHHNYITAGFALALPPRSFGQESRRASHVSPAHIPTGPVRVIVFHNYIDIYMCIYSARSQGGVVTACARHGRSSFKNSRK